MKKIVVILLMLIYGVSSPGATLYVHYCCGKIDKIDFTGSKKENCPFQNKISQKGCCDNKEVELKIKSDYKAETEVKAFFKVYDVTINSFAAVYSLNAVNSKRSLYFTNVSPPLSASIPLYISNCIFRI